MSNVWDEGEFPVKYESEKNFVSSTTGIGVPFSSNIGSGCSLRSLQKCMQTVLEVENLKPFTVV